MISLHDYIQEEMFISEDPEGTKLQILTEDSEDFIIESKPRVLPEKFNLLRELNQDPSLLKRIVL
jgi:hypothetical protein